MDARTYDLERPHYRAAPSVTVRRSVHRSPLPVYHDCGGLTRGGGEEGRLASQMLQVATWTKGTSRLGPP